MGIFISYFLTPKLAYQIIQHFSIFWFYLAMCPGDILILIHSELFHFFLQLQAIPLCE